jgi:RNA polymerase sigma factor (sigma-70 family)
MSAAPSAQKRKQFVELLEAKKPLLTQMASRITGCPCLAEDIVQDTMVKLCESGMPGGVQSPVSYLFRMVRNLAIDCARRRARECGIAELSDDSPELAACSPCPETQLARCQALRLVMIALQELPERTRHAFELHRIDGVPQREIASKMQVSPTLVNFMVRDAHNHCRLKLLSHRMDSDLVPPPQGASRSLSRPRRA